MKKLLSLIVLSLVMMTGLAWAQGLETFENFDHDKTTYIDGNFVGDNSITWYYVHVAGSTMGTDSFPIDGNGMILRRSGNDSKIYSESITGGIGDFSVQMRKAFTGTGDRQIALYVNGVFIQNSQTFGGTSGANATVYTFSVNNINIPGNVVIELRHITGGTSNRQLTIDNITWTGYSATNPSIVITPESLDAFTYVQNAGPSASQMITVSGTNLTNKVIVAAPENYEVSSDNNSFGDIINLTNITDGTLADKDVYVRLQSGLNVDTYSGNLSVSSVGATSKTVSLIGNVIKPAPTHHAINFHASAGVPPCSTIKVTWENPTGMDAPDGYLILASETGYNSITDPINGVAVADLKYSKNATGTSGEVVFNQLDANTTYYFKIYPYNNAGSSILYYTGGEIPTAQAKTAQEPETFIFWDFNDSTPASNNNWAKPIASTIGTGSLDYTFTQAYSFDGTTLNGLTGTDAGGSFAPRGGSGNVNNGKHFDLIIPTTGYANIGLSYAVRNSSTGFQKNEIYYSTNGSEPYIKFGEIENITTSFATKSFDFSEISGANNNPNFRVRVVLTGATDASGNNRFDNIRITGSEICTYETNVPVPITDGPTVTMTKGRANNSSTDMPTIPNTSLGEHFLLKLALLDDGHWTIEIVSTVYSDCAYNWQGSWHVVEKNGNKFMITVSKDAKSGDNDLFIVLANDNPTLPVELSSFLVTLNSNGKPVITWETQTETGVNGFYIYRGVNKSLSEAALISSLVPATNSSLAHSYSFIDTDLSEDGTYYYWLNVSDLNGHESYYGPAELNFVLTDEDTVPEVTYSTALRSIYPNPFNPSANIGFELAEASEVKISVYNTRGQLVRSFAPFTHGAGKGSIIWDGKDDGGNSASSGIYLFRMKVGAKVYNMKALMLK